MKLLWCFNKAEVRNAKFIFHAVEVNESIFEQYQKEQSEIDEKQRLQEAQSAAFNAMPDFAKETIKDIEGTSPVSALENLVRDRVEDALVRPKVSAWDKEYRDVANLIISEEYDSSLNVENVLRMEGYLGGMRDRYNAFEKVALEKQDENKKMRQRGRASHRVMIWKKSDSIGANELAHFNMRKEIVANIFKEFENKINDAKKSAESYLDGAAQALKINFEGFTPNQQKTFMEGVQKEIDTGVGNHGLSSPFNNILDLAPKNHRIEVYKKLGWYVDTNTDLSNETIKKSQTDLTNLRNKVDSPSADPDFEKIKEFMSDVSSSGDAPQDIPAFIEAIEDYITSHGSDNIERVYSGVSIANELGSSKFLFLSKYLEDNESLTRSMTKELKSQYLGYISSLENTERPDNIDSYSNTFSDQHKKINDLFTSSATPYGVKELLTKLETVTDHTKITNPKLKLITDFEDKYLTIKGDYENVKPLLDTNEEPILSKYWDTLEEFTGKANELKNKWAQEKKNYKDWQDDYKDWQDKCDTPGDGYLKEIADAEAKLADPTLGKMQRAQIEKRANMYRKKILEGGRGPQTPDFTTINSHLGIDFETTIKKNQAEMLSRSLTAQSWKKRITERLKSDSKKEQNEVFLKELETYQQEQFDILLKCPKGRKVAMDFESYSHGKNFACGDVLARRAQWQSDFYVLDSTEDVVVLKNSAGKVMFVQKTKTEGAFKDKINVILLDNALNYLDPTTGKISFNTKLSANVTDKQGEPFAMKFS